MRHPSDWPAGQPETTAQLTALRRPYVGQGGDPGPRHDTLAPQQPRPLLRPRFTPRPRPGPPPQSGPQPRFTPRQAQPAPDPAQLRPARPRPRRLLPAIIGDELRIPILWCQFGTCIERYTHRDALGERDLRLRALAAGWRYDLLGRLACPSCVQHDGTFWVARPPVPARLHWRLCACGEQLEHGPFGVALGRHVAELPAFAQVG